uniref:Aminotransferase-like plant mobile domain-containing protein n=1 Tax=Solanum tuberosum TaxID=4113 RepID=M1C3Z4_SOLTU
MKVHPPVIGAFPLLRKTLDTSHHLPEWSSTEAKDVTNDFSGNVTTEKVLLLKSSTHQNVVVAVPPRRDEHLSSWRVLSSGFGEVHYTSGYWEWVEDELARCKETLDNMKTYDAIFASMFTYDHNENVLQAFCENWRPSTNTVSTFVGELSISLWDLRTIGGLYVHGSFYDEVIPSAKELTHVDDQGKSFLPRSCSFLFSAFYRLTKGAIDEVSFREWTKFWFRGPRKYAEPSPRTFKNHTIPRKVDCIHASVFKVASLMAHGEIFSLAVPVLANIYRGLRDISTSSNLGACNTLLPFHYVYGWIGEYFETYFRITRPQRVVRIWQIFGEKMAKHFDLVDARKLFQQVNVHDLHNLAMLQGNELHIDDSGKLSTSWSDFLIGLRSSFVTLRLDDELIVEPYSPHRFS